MQKYRWTMPLLGVIGCVFLFSAPAFAASIAIFVPGTSDIWLAGMPAGSGASGFAPGTPVVDFAPGQSPVLVPLTIVSGYTMTFKNVTGEVKNGPLKNAYGPDGNSDQLRQHYQGAQNGISDIYAPHNSLIGVFLGPGSPDLNSPPQGLDFSTQEMLNFFTLSPILQQVFFIGDGLANNSQIQEFLVPSGATSLYLGTMDGWEWNNNGGGFSLTVESASPPPTDPATTVPEPSAFILLCLGLLGVTLAYRRMA